MPKTQFILFILLSGLFWVLTACQSITPGTSRGQEPLETKTMMPVARERATAGNGGLLMVTDFRGDGGPKSGLCRWRMIHKDSGQSYFVNLAVGTTATFTSLPPGIYLTGRLGCGISKVWDLDKIFANGISIEADHVSYIGKLTFVFQGAQLKEVKKGSRLESAGTLGTALNVVPAGSGPLVSGFTLRSITPAMYQGVSASEGFDIQATGLKSASSALESVARNLKTCANTESAADPLRIGRLDYTVLYKQGRFSEMKSRDDENAFSDRMRACVEQSLMKYQSPDRGDFEVRVRY